MKKQFVLISVLAISLCLPVFAQNTEKHPFYGYWARKAETDTLVFYFLGNYYQIMTVDTATQKYQLASTGIFSVNNNQMKLYETNRYKSGSVNFTYTVVSNDIFALSKDVNDTPLVGLWVKLDIPDTQPEGEFSKLTGVWESIDNGVFIFRVYTDGEGWFYKCAPDMTLEDCWPIKFIATNSETGKQLNSTGSAFGEGTWSVAGDYRIAGDSLVIGARTYTRQRNVSGGR
jgi:hypothetical protein